MYKVVRISDLNYSPTFVSSDKVIELSDDTTKMTVGENDYAHKSKAYLSNCINIADKSLKSYRDAIDKIDTTYLTSTLNDIYLPEGSLITEETLDKIMNSDAFLTKDACKEFETKCISYINELKNKAVSILMAQLNESFISQNSVGKLTYGQWSGGNGHSHSITWDPKIVTNQSLTEISDSNYNFETGEFSINQLLFNETKFKSVNGSVIADFWKNNYENSVSSYFMNEDFESFEEFEDKIVDEIVFNGSTENGKPPDFKVYVPKASYDYKKNKSIPMAKLVEIFLKRQCKTAIKRICDQYISKMVSIPKFDYTPPPSNS